MQNEAGLAKLRDGLFHRAGKILRPLGISVLPAAIGRPCAWGVSPITGSFPSPSEFACVGGRKNYFIHDGYRHRGKAIFYDDRQNTDESQLEVYQFARELCDRENLKNVVDIGCGSAYKLMRYLGSLATIGIDVPATCQWLREKYPDRVWVETGSFAKPDHRVDLVIASDVIEHVEKPDELMEFVTSLQPRYIILSTPDRNLLRDGTHNGPPTNVAHIREWSYFEFRAYVSEHFELVEHFISCTPQATQCVLCRRLSSKVAG